MNYYEKGKPLGYLDEYMIKIDKEIPDQHIKKSHCHNEPQHSYQNNMKSKYGFYKEPILDKVAGKLYDIKLDPNYPKPFSIDLFPLDEGFYKGTIYKNKYIPYKNYRPRMVRPTSEKGRILFEVNKYYFALHEIRMYLDVFPYSQEAINLFSKFQDAYIQSKHAYETRFGPLDIEAPNLDTVPFKWAMTKWPWEGGYK